MAKTNLSTEELKNEIDMKNLPKHIGIIMDGNGRWAKKRFMPRNYGHQEGVKRVIEIVTAANNLGIEYLSLYAFSTENWKRPEEEINGLMKILVFYINSELDKLHRNNVKVKTMGDIEKLPTFAKKEVNKSVNKTYNNTGMVLNIGLNYGSRDEIIYGIENLFHDINEGRFSLEDLDAKSFKKYLYTGDQPDLDLLIRPSGELRISNFMLYQAAYSEFYFSDVLWPDFKEKDLLLAIMDYQKRDRRFGGI